MLGGGGAGANSHSLSILIDLYLGASLGLQPEGYKWEGRNRRKNKKKRFLEMNVPSWFEREMGFGGSCLPPRPAGETFEGTELAGSMPVLGRQLTCLRRGVQPLLPQCPRPPHWAQTHAGLTFVLPWPNGKWEVTSRPFFGRDPTAAAVGPTGSGIYIEDLGVRPHLFPYTSGSSQP